MDANLERVSNMPDVLRGRRKPDDFEFVAVAVGGRKDRDAQLAHVLAMVLAALGPHLEHGQLRDRDLRSRCPPNLTNDQNIGAVQVSAVWRRRAQWGGMAKGSLFSRKGRFLAFRAFGACGVAGGSVARPHVSHG